MEKPVFRIDRNKKYIIYGAGGDGIKMSGILENAHAEIWGYIDARAGSIGRVNGFHAYTLKEAAEIISDKNNYVVIVTVKNLFEHSRIVGDLVSKGFDQCIYKPSEVLQETENSVQAEIGQVYDQLILERNLPVGKEIGKSEKYLKLACRDNFLIKTDHDRVFTWMPEELIYNYDDLQDAYGCISMPAFFPLVELYRLFMGQYASEGEAEEVIDNFIFYSMEWMNKNKIACDDELKKSLIRSRNNVFTEMQKIFETDKNFFIRNAPKVSRGDNGAFYMSSSGRNRIAFLLARDYHYVPVNMSVKDYQQWINENAYHDILRYLEEKGTDILEIPVSHPFLSSISVKYTEYIHLFCAKCMNIIVKHLYDRSRKKEDKLWIVDRERLKRNMEKEKAACALLDYGCMRRYLMMNGISSETVNISENQENVEIEERLDKLLPVRRCRMRNNTEYTILIMDSRAAGRIEKGLINSVSQIFLLNWKEEKDCLSDCLEQGYVICRKLFTALWDCRLVEGYWLKKQ